ncbi:MAG TPA: DUF885 family protein [Alphaproteobacteria bacterium]|nr:DUF885 family protein [Alphaproteobacteria bacterium]
MPKRREFLLGGAAALLTMPMGRLLAESATSASTPSASLAQILDKIMDGRLADSPEETTSLGLDRDARADAAAKLDDRSLAARSRYKRHSAEWLALLKSVDRSHLHGMDAVNYDTVAYVTEAEVNAYDAFDYGAQSSGMPYVLSQLTGAYHSVPDFLDSKHRIESKQDAEAYLARLDGFAVALGQDDECARHDAGIGVVPPGFILDKALVQLRALASQGPDKSVLVQSIVRRCGAKGIAGDWEAKASAAYQEKIRPALGREIALLEEMRRKAPAEAGIARLPNGPAYYRDSLKYWTTTTMSPEEIHKTGLALVESLSANADAMMKTNGLTQGSVGARLKSMYADPRYRYPNTDAAKETLIADLNAKVADIQARLPAYFHTLPKAKLEIRRVPKYLEAGAAGGYYTWPALDGSHPGTYYINLRDTAEVPRWTLPTITYHEGIPGHHLQISLQQEASLPLIRRASFFSAYMEGWALYAEQLADEMGVYAQDPTGRIGYLQAALFRAVRLVVDTGLHAKGWSRDQAIAYYVDKLGEPQSAAVTEIERYCVWPGQACAYMLGKLTWLELRERAKKKLGARYDIRLFHDAGLLVAPVPLTVLDTVIDGYIAGA